MFYSVCVCVCLLDTTVSTTETDEPIDMPFGMWIWWAQETMY